MAANSMTRTGLRMPSRIAMLSLAVTFALGAVGGALAIEAPRLLTQTTQPAPVPAPAPGVPTSLQADASGRDLDRLLADLEAAAERHDARMYASFRERLVRLIGSTPMNRYLEMTGS